MIPSPIHKKIFILTLVYVRGNALCKSVAYFYQFKGDYNQNWISVSMIAATAATANINNTGMAKVGYTQ